MRWSVPILAMQSALVSCNHASYASEPVSARAVPASPVVVPAEAQAAVGQATADAAARTGIEAAAWSVTRVRKTQWPDASLGCAKPGELYAQVLVPGFVIELTAQGRSLEYHSGGKRIVHCG